ncbi:hypothetical protein G7Y89_g9013 [Cudoniella acicularis]|uniref:Uncharacterized protein n=1 Tax=Cudoniella acicularis TaxID=354080 RepID=A0A8H4RIA3_9HELO|nr:hypothetical protein G7Y89_g9013 [Cudoniella acicularis]
MIHQILGGSERVKNECDEQTKYGKEENVSAYIISLYPGYLHMAKPPVRNMRELHTNMIPQAVAARSSKWQEDVDQVMEPGISPIVQSPPSRTLTRRGLSPPNSPPVNPLSGHPFQTALGMLPSAFHHLDSLHAVDSFFAENLLPTRILKYPAPLSVFKQGLPRNEQLERWEGANSGLSLEAD